MLLADARDLSAEWLPSGAGAAGQWVSGQGAHLFLGLAFLLRLCRPWQPKCYSSSSSYDVPFWQALRTVAVLPSWYRMSQLRQYLSYLRGASSQGGSTPSPPHAPLAFSPPANHLGAHPLLRIVVRPRWSLCGLLTYCQRAVQTLQYSRLLALRSRAIAALLIVLVAAQSLLLSAPSEAVNTRAGSRPGRGVVVAGASIPATTSATCSLSCYALKFTATSSTILRKTVCPPVLGSVCGGCVSATST